MTAVKFINIERLNGMSHDFLLAADRCLDLSVENLNSKKFEPLSMPSFVLRAFSAELSMKTIMAVRDIKITQTHNLRSLFIHLPEDIRLRIINALKKHPILCINGLEDDFLARLDNICDTFERVRYIYEEDGGPIVKDVELIYKFSIVVRRISEGEFKSWSSKSH